MARVEVKPWRELRWFILTPAHSAQRVAWDVALRFLLPGESMPDSVREDLERLEEEQDGEMSGQAKFLRVLKCFREDWMRERDDEDDW